MRWESEVPPPAAVPMSLGGWCRVVIRGSALAVLVFGGLILMLLLRLVERPVFGHSRPVTPWLTVFVCRNALRIIGLRVMRHGAVMPHAGAFVANHSSWLDIFILNSAAPVYFVSKSEVAGWPGIGWLARATGTVFIDRNPRHARVQRDMLTKRLLSRHRLVFFPEGTSTDGQRVLPFKSTLFSAVCNSALTQTMWVQPISIVFHPSGDLEQRHYGWWGSMSFGAHFIKVLATKSQGQVEVLYHPPLSTAEFTDRKAMAAQSARLVLAGYKKLSKHP